MCRMWSNYMNEFLFVKTTKQVPCKDCKERHASCHAECEKYKDYKSTNDAEREKRFKKNKADQDYYSYRWEMIHRTKKKKHARIKRGNGE